MTARTRYTRGTAAFGLTVAIAALSSVADALICVVLVLIVWGAVKLRNGGPSDGPVGF